MIPEPETVSIDKISFETNDSNIENEEKNLEDFEFIPVETDEYYRLVESIVPEEIKELDMNPVLVMEKGKGCRILDVRIGL